MDKRINVMLAIKERTMIFYHKDTNLFDYSPVSKEELKNISVDKSIPYKDTNNIKLPSYDEINHKEIMTFFVKECVEDKMIRKQLFNVLRRHNYMEAYLDKLHELDLYDAFIDACGDIYIQIFQEWAYRNNVFQEE